MNTAASHLDGAVRRLCVLETRTTPSYVKLSEQGFEELLRRWPTISREVPIFEGLPVVVDGTTTGRAMTIWAALHGLWGVSVDFMPGSSRCDCELIPPGPVH